MQSKNVEFQFKGSRSYVQGPDIFNVMISGYQTEELRAIRFSVHGFVSTSVCKLVESINKADCDSQENVKARCQFEYQGEMHYQVLVDQSDYKVTGQRVEYDEDQVVALMNVDGEEILLNSESPFTFIETIVSMNKYHLKSLFPDDDGKWIFTRIDLVGNFEDRSNLRLVFKRNMNFRLTKSEVLVNNKKVGDIYFSLVKS